MRRIQPLANILEVFELHDSQLQSVLITHDGKMQIEIDVDDVWNRELGTAVRGLILHNVCEITHYRLDELSVIGDVDLVEIEDYDRSIATSERQIGRAVMVSFDLVAGGSLGLVFSGMAEMLT